jgi:hypothetical protein
MGNPALDKLLELTINFLIPAVIIATLAGHLFSLGQRYVSGLVRTKFQDCTTGAKK